VTVNGYYIEMVLCTIFGILWYGVFKNILKNLQMKCPSQWLVNYVKQPITKNVFTITAMWYILIAFWVKNRRYCMVLLANRSTCLFNIHSAIHSLPINQRRYELFWKRGYEFLIDREQIPFNQNKKKYIYSCIYLQVLTSLL